jgi:hypothetical protein
MLQVPDVWHAYLLNSASQVRHSSTVPRSCASGSGAERDFIAVRVVAIVSSVKKWGCKSTDRSQVNEEDPSNKDIKS